MIIAISSTGKDLDSRIDPRFGRCAFFIIYDTKEGSFEAFDNESIGMSGGAGIQAAQFVASKGVKAVVTGNCGPNAVKTLNAAGIELYLGQSGSVREGIENFQNHLIRPSNEANVSDHFGMKNDAPGSSPKTGRMGMEWTPGQGGGMGRGRGMGRGGGRGMGRGMGRGAGIGMGMGRNQDIQKEDRFPQNPQENLTKGQELSLLKEQSRELQKQMAEIQAQIEKLEKKA